MIDQSTEPKNNIRRIITILVVLIGVGFFIVQFVFAKGAPKNLKCEGVAIEMFRTQAALISPLDLGSRKNNERTLKEWKKIIADCESRADGAQTAAFLPQLIHTTPLASVTPQISIPTITPTVTPGPSGIFDGQPGAFFHSFEAKIQNHWRGSINGYNVTVFAGAWVNDPNQGFLAVMLSPTHGHAIWGYFPGPKGSGALRIVDAVGYRLSVQQTNYSNLLFFDLPAKIYVDSLDVTLTPLTPMPVVETIQPTSIPPYPVFETTTQPD